MTLRNFKPDYLEIEPRELVRYLLKESCQQERNSLNPANILDLLKLEHVILDFDTDFPLELSSARGKPRAILSFPDKLIASDKSLRDYQMRFSVCHEIAHYVLPNHQYSLYLCNSKDFSFSTQLIFEKEANDFAADLLFVADKFTLEANNKDICAGTVKQMGEKYEVSFEATARRLVERSFRPCMLVVFEKEADRSRIDPDLEQKWKVRYCVGSPAFRAQYFTGVEGEVPSDIASRLMMPGIDIATSVHKEITIKAFKFDAEFFTNSYNVFGLFAPVQR